LHTVIKIAAMSSVIVLLAACGSAKDANKSNFSTAIQTYLDTQKGLCAAIPAKGSPFTLSNRDTIGSSKKRADALVEAGLLSKRDTEVKAMFGDKMEPGSEYQLTEVGQKFLVPNGANTMGGHDAFCTGKFTVVAVDNFTEPSDMMGVKVSQVNYRFKLEDAEDWARSEAIGANYRNFAERAKAEEISGKAALILTNDGWMHERLFKRG
jgi:hypothetical protein